MKRIDTFSDEVLETLKETRYWAHECGRTWWRCDKSGLKCIDCPMADKGGKCLDVKRDELEWLKWALEELK